MEVNYNTHITHYRMTLKIILTLNMYVCVCRQIITIVIIVIIVTIFNINFFHW